MPPGPLEACAFGAHLGNWSIFILDPRLLWCMGTFICYSHGTIHPLTLHSGLALFLFEKA